jgi:hypothetical protein
VESPVDFDAGMKAPDADFLLPAADLGNVVSRLHPHGVSTFAANAFSMRRAISPERLALPFSKLEGRHDTLQGQPRRPSRTGRRAP